MKLLLIGFASLTLACVAHAEESGETKPLDLPDFSKVNSPPQKKSAIKVESSCRTSSGRTLKKNEPGYESCMRAAQVDLSRTHGTSVGPTSGPAPGATFQIGN